MFKLDSENEGELQFVGDVPSLKRPLPGVTPILITSLKFDSLGRLFMGGQDGFLRMAGMRSFRAMLWGTLQIGKKFTSTIFAVT